MGCAETFVMRLPDCYHQAARDALARRSRSACGSRRSLAGDSPETRRSTSDRGSEVLRRVSGESPAELRPYLREWAGRVAVGEGPEGGLFGEPTWAGAINRDSGNRQRSKAEAPPGHGFDRSATFPKGLTAVVRVGDDGKASAGVACSSQTVPSAAAGIDYFRVEDRSRALRTTVTQNLICASWLAIFVMMRYFRH
jgi:hypothetical protein